MIVDLGDKKIDFASSLSSVCDHLASDIPTTMGQPYEPVATLLASVALSYAAYFCTAMLIPLLGPDLVAKGLGGKDMLKAGFKRDEEVLEMDDALTSVDRASTSASTMLYVSFILLDASSRNDDTNLSDRPTGRKLRG